MRRFASTLVVPFLPCLLAAAPPGSLSLEVRDPHAAAVAEAEVAVHDRAGNRVASGRSDAHGLCQMAGLPSGEYLVTVDRPGFARFGPRRVRVDDGATQVAAVLAVQGVREQLVVTAGARAQGTHELAKSLTVVDDREMLARGDLLLADALRATPATMVAEFGAPGSATTVRTRGMRPQDTAVLIDGMRLRDPSAPQGDAGPLLEDVMLGDIERIEVLRGSGSSLYGSHAMSGAVNLVSSEGGGPLGGSVSLESGSLGLVRGQARVRGALANGRVTWSAGLARTDRTRGLDDHDEAAKTALQASLRLRLAPATRAFFRFHGADARTFLDDSPTALPPLRAGVEPAVAGTSFVPSADDPDSRRESRFASALLRFEHHGRRLACAVTYHGLRTRRLFLDGPRGASGYEPATDGAWRYGGATDTVSGRLDAQLGRAHSASYGYEVEREALDDEARPEPRGERSGTQVSQLSHAFFGQHEARFLNGRLSAAVSARVQIFALRAPEFEPAAGAPFAGNELSSPAASRTLDASVLFSASATTRLRAHAGTGYRAPSLFERFGSGYASPFGYSVYGDPTLAPERSFAIDAALDRTLAGGRGQLSAAFFRTSVHDTIVFDFSGALDPATDAFGRAAGYRAAGRARARGLEITGLFRPTQASRFSTAYSLVEADAPSGEPDAPRALGIPRHQLSLLLLVGLDRPLTASVQFAGSSQILARVGGRVLAFGGRRALDVRVSARILQAHALRLQARVSNALGRVEYASGFLTPGRTLTAGARYDW